MRILYHHRTLGDGAEGIHIREVVAALRALGHDVRVVSLIGEEGAGGSAGRVRWKRFSSLIPSSVYELAELAYNVVGSRNISAAIREFEPDVIYDRYNSYSTAAIHAGRRCGLPVVLEVNSPVAYERTEYEHLRLKLPWLARRYERWICTRADHVFAVSTPLKQHLVEAVGVLPDRVEVLPNGVNPETFNPFISGEPVRARHGLQGRTVVGFVGILRPWHGVEMLIEAIGGLVADWPDIHLLVVGDGPIQHDLETSVRRLGLSDRVTFTGRLAHADVREHVAAMDVAVSPRATFYASPMKILEYMALARPVIAPDMRNIRDLVDDGRTGLLFAPDDVAALRACLRRMLESEELRRAMGAEARRRVEARYNWHYNARAVVSAAARLLEVRMASPARI